MVFLILRPGAYSIEIGFSAEEGGDSVGIYNDYEVSNGVSINEEAEAKFGNLEMTDDRMVEGAGDISLTQNLFGSGGYSGQSFIHASGFSGRIENHAVLQPSTLYAQQLANVDGEEIYDELKLKNKDSFVATYSQLTDGRLDVSQSVCTGSAHAYQDTYINALSGEAGSLSRRLNENGVSDHEAITYNWLTDGELAAIQQADAKSDGVYASQYATLSASAGGIQTSSQNWNAGGLLGINYAGVDNEGEGGTWQQACQFASADGRNSHAHQWAIAKAGDTPESYAEVAAEAGSGSILDTGGSDVSQNMRKGSVHAYQDNHINALSREAGSLSEKLNEEGVIGHVATTYSWLTGGELTAIQQADMKSNGAYAYQWATVETGDTPESYAEVAAEAGSGSIPDTGGLDVSQHMRKGSVHAYQDNHINALSREAGSLGEKLNEDSVIGHVATTYSWITGGELTAIQQADTKSDFSYASQYATLSASEGGSQTSSESSRYWNGAGLFEINYADVANEGYDGTWQQAYQFASADGRNSDAYQWVIAETGDDPYSVVEVVAQGAATNPDWLFIPRGSWLRDAVYGTNSILYYEGSAHSDDKFTQADFISGQEGPGVVSGVAGYYLYLPIDDPFLEFYFPDIWPLYCIADWKDTSSLELIQGHSAESLDGDFIGTIREVQFSPVI